MADNKSRELAVKVDVDVSEALTGLKAVQREAKEATKALRELERVSTEQTNGGHSWGAYVKLVGPEGLVVPEGTKFKADDGGTFTSISPALLKGLSDPAEVLAVRMSGHSFNIIDLAPSDLYGVVNVVK